MLELGRPDCVLAEDEALPLVLRARALFEADRPDELVRKLEAVERQRPIQLDEALYFAAGYDALQRPEDALLALQRSAPRADSPIYPEFEKLCRKYDRQRLAVRSLLRRGAIPGGK